MSLTKISAAPISPLVRLVLVPSRTLALTALVTSPRLPMISSTSSSAERPDRMLTLELKSIFCVWVSTTLPWVPPLASERLLTSGSCVTLIEAPLRVSTKKASLGTRPLWPRLGSFVLRGPAVTSAAAAPNTLLAIVVVLLAVALTQPNRPVERANDCACVATLSKRAIRSTPSRPVRLALAPRLTLLTPGMVMVELSWPSL